LNNNNPIVCDPSNNFRNFHAYIFYLLWQSQAMEVSLFHLIFISLFLAAP